MVIRSELVFSKSLVQVSLTWFNTSVRHIRTTGTPKKNCHNHTMVEFVREFNFAF